MTATLDEGDYATPSEVAAEIADEARANMGRLRGAWPLLGEARAPGRPGPPAERPVDRRFVAIRIAAGKAERRDALLAVWAGNAPSAPHAAPIRLPVVHVRAVIAGELYALTGRMWEALGRGHLVLPIPDPTGRVPLRPCTWCTGTGVLTPPLGWVWDWPADALTCPRCIGEGKLPPHGRACPTCHVEGPCPCDHADATVHHTLAAIGRLLALAGVESASDAEETLADLADLAEHTLGLGRDRRRLKGAECPCCGSRELVPEVSSHNRVEWSITCYGPDCVCAGPGCPCGIGTQRRRGKRHRWPARHWDGPRGLAHRLGVRLPGTMRAWGDVIGAGGTRSTSAVGRPTIEGAHPCPSPTAPE
jgi:hypothetical protein